MTLENAIVIVNQFKEKNGPVLTILDAMLMQKLFDVGYEVYSTQKGNVTFMARICKDGTILTQYVCW